MEGTKQTTLVVNVGNTAISFATFEGENMGRFKRLFLRGLGDSEEAWREVFEPERLGEIRASIIGSVNPCAHRTLSGYLKRWTRAPVFICGENFEFPMKTRVREPQAVGVDRLANALASFEMIKGPVLVADFGTAVTFDFVNGEGVFEGGLIFPGIGLAALSLQEHTRKLPLVTPGKTEVLIGRDTVEAIQAGLYWGYRSLAERLAEKLRLELQVPLRMVATGGDAELITSGLRHPFLLRPYLTLEGLRLALLTRPIHEKTES